MFSNAERKQMRLSSRVTEEVGIKTYNMVLGGMIAYGLFVNAAMVLLCNGMFDNMDYRVFLIGYFISCIAGSIISVKSNNPVVSFIGYNLIVAPIGVLLTVCVPEYSSEAIMSAMLTTGAVVVTMMAIASIAPQVFARMGMVLFLSLLIGFIAELITMFLGYGGDFFNWFFVVVFSLYIGYDWSKAQAYPKTIDNAIDSAIDIYLDIINLFVRLLEIFGKKND